MGRVHFFLLVSLLLGKVMSAAPPTFTLPKVGERNKVWGSEEIQERLPLRRLSHHNPRTTMTCDRVPKVCRAKGSPGRDCCRKLCVNLRTDTQNCGCCGKKCRYAEACCRGKCVNILSSRANCGACHRRCRKGSYCRFGMCGYA
ncbi:unnamed protein product [Spirodela intermedia]|uniref:Uncharacterized protein n=1 Tax=Spirodela intermedia TaxID=51605 RepID=A0A7I8KIW6_SPIIN|nr:unnamed protein product [Spirodela intermedia]